MKSLGDSSLRVEWLEDFSDVPFSFSGVVIKRQAEDTPLLENVGEVSVFPEAAAAAHPERKQQRRCEIHPRTTFVSFIALSHRAQL